MDLDPQQLRLLDRLGKASGAPVTFAELHASGVHYPAAVISELLLAGYRIERVRDAQRQVGVRLAEIQAQDPAPDPAAGRRLPAPLRRAVFGTD